MIVERGITWGVGNPAGMGQAGSGHLPPGTDVGTTLEQIKELLRESRERGEFLTSGRGHEVVSRIQPGLTFYGLYAQMNQKNAQKAAALQSQIQPWLDLAAQVRQQGLVKFIPRAVREAVASLGVRWWLTGPNRYQGIYRRAVAAPHMLTDDEIADLLLAGVDIFGAAERARKEEEALQIPEPPLPIPTSQKSQAGTPAALTQAFQTAGTNAAAATGQIGGTAATAGVGSAFASAERQGVEQLGRALADYYLSAVRGSEAESEASRRFLRELERQTQMRLADLEGQRQAALEGAGRFIASQTGSSAPTTSGVAASRLGAAALDQLSASRQQARAAEAAMEAARLQAAIQDAERQRQLANLRLNATAQLVALGLDPNRFPLPSTSMPNSQGTTPSFFLGRFGSAATRRTEQLG